jgi:mono/diheme cytochrome c family protein
MMADCFRSAALLGTLAALLVLAGCEAEEEPEVPAPAPVVVQEPVQAPTTAPLAMVDSVADAPVAQPVQPAPVAEPPAKPDPEPERAPAPAPAAEPEPEPEPEPAPEAPAATPVRTAALQGDPAQGKKLYTKWGCFACHGSQAGGGMGPSLVDADWLYGGTDADVFQSIHDGRPRGMPAWGDKLSEKEIQHVIAFIRSLQQ